MTKRLTLAQARRIAAEVIAKDYPTVELLGVTAGKAGSRYTEVILGIRGCHTEPCQVIIGVERDGPEDVFKAEVDKEVREHLGRTTQNRRKAVTPST